jgi:hypothetical protein
VSSRDRSERVYDDHTDWVNDVVLLGDEATLVTGRWARALAVSSLVAISNTWSFEHPPAPANSGSDCFELRSSDNTIKFWNVQTGQCVATYVEHTDYVKALAYARSRGLLASAGLDREVVLWDLEGSTQPVAAMGGGRLAVRFPDQQRASRFIADPDWRGADRQRHGGARRSRSGRGVCGSANHVAEVLGPPGLSILLGYGQRSNRVRVGFNRAGFDTCNRALADVGSSERREGGALERTHRQCTLCRHQR